VADDFYSFDEALDELKLKEEELKRLVSEGELRAFRKGDTMKIRRADVELLRAELDADVADLDDTADELVFEEDSDLDADAGMATQELDVETLVDDEEPAAAAPAPARASRSSASARPARRSAVAAAAEEEEEEPAWVKGLLMVSALLLMLAMPIMLSLGTGNAGGLAKGVAGLFGAEFDQAAAAQSSGASAEE
jgi:excisionase family DNA binding protein